jgi:serine/threonine-protein kinase
MERSDPSLIETVAHPAISSASTPSSSSFAEEGRFVAGTLLAGRYRILGLLGRGGMGEVYRATDLMLGQSVALKFLPEEAARDSRLIERFQGEVRVARQVSHPNVCRVYDIGQIDGMPFISMEYVDGEDLSSLLLRIGRLPADKALEAARKLCAGLAAAHDRGVIHRDLKPQNIMMNKRGEVVIMDFGLAAVAGGLSGAEARNGTPAYMSPEQLKGAEVTVRSDIYALGLVLYELFTGKRPYEAKNIPQLIDMQESLELTSMSSIAPDVDPAVEKVIRRCLDPDPARRPATALSVSAALPGGDPLSEALAAGEMPSPELVAASGKVEGLDLKYSIPLLVVTVLCLLATLPIRMQTNSLLHAPLDLPPDALQNKAREFAASFGYTNRPADTALWINKRTQMIISMARLPKPLKWDEWMAAESPIDATVRESPELLIAQPTGEVTKDNPAPTTPGMLEANINGDGRLSWFEAVPLGGDGITPVPPEAVFQAAGFDLTKFTPRTPQFHERFAHDQQLAWTGPHPSIPGITVNVDAAWWKGRVTMARVDLKFPDAPKASASTRPVWIEWLITAANAIGIFFGILLARKNWKSARSDRKGALRLGWVMLIVGFVIWIGKVHPVPDSSMLTIFFTAAGEWLFDALVMWVLYLALEPAVRARWPHSIVSWNRLLAGKWISGSFDRIPRWTQG